MNVPVAGRASTGGGTARNDGAAAGGGDGGGAAAGAGAAAALIDPCVGTSTVDSGAFDSVMKRCPKTFFFTNSSATRSAMRCAFGRSACSKSALPLLSRMSITPTSFPRK